MTPEKALLDILRVMADKAGLPVIYEKDEVDHWPSGLFEALNESGLLQEAQPAYSLFCDGCEENCMEPVHVLPETHSAPAHAFIVCNSRDDIGRVPVEMSRLYRWQITPKSTACFLSKKFNIQSFPRELVTPCLWDLGRVNFDGRWHNLFFSSVIGPALSELLSRDLMSYELSEAIFFVPLLIGSHQPESINCISIFNILQFISNHLEIDTRIFRRLHSQRTAIEQTDYLFRRNDTRTWEIRFAGSSCPPLPEKIGYHYIMHLLKNPDKKISRTELFRILNPVEKKADENHCDGILLDEGLNIKTSMIGKTDTDQKAEVAYRKRAEDLGKERKEAKMIGDVEKVCKIDQEMDDLTAEIYAAKLSKKTAKSSPEMKRQRESVYKAINSAIHSLEKIFPDLGHHLSSRIKTIESEYVYSPQPPEPNWLF